MARPIQEWLNQPQNKALFDKITEDMNQEYAQGKYRRKDEPNVIDPDAFEAERNWRKSSLTEQLIEEAPDEYLSEHDLKMRRQRYEPAADEDEEDAIDEDELDLYRTIEELEALRSSLRLNSP